MLCGENADVGDDFEYDINGDANNYIRTFGIDIIMLLLLLLSQILLFNHAII